MGLFTRGVENANSLFASNATVPVGSPSGSRYSGIVSPYVGGNSLDTIVLQDILGDASWLPVGRSEAASIPAIAAARNLVCGQLSRLPLKALKDGAELDNQPTWLYRTNGAVSPQLRMLWTLDDLMFHGHSLWIVTRGTDGAITDGVRVPYERWTINSKYELLIDNEPVSSDEVIYFPGFTDGLLTSGARTIRAALDLENTRAQRLRNPSPITELHLTDDASLSEEEIVEVRDNWADARRSANGAVAVTPAGIQAIDHGTVPVDLFIEAQNSVAVNVAQHLGIPAAMIDAAVNGGSTSFNYSSTQMDRDWFINSGLAFWAEAVTSRLSMDDCVPRGTYVQVDFDPIAPAEVAD